MCLCRLLSDALNGATVQNKTELHVYLKTKSCGIWYYMLISGIAPLQMVMNNSGADSDSAYIW